MVDDLLTKISKLESSLDVFLDFQRQMSLYSLVLVFRLSHVDSQCEVLFQKSDDDESIASWGLSQTFADVSSKFHVSGRKLWSRLSISSRLGIIIRQLGT